MKPLITIAMPVYNVEKYIERAVLSALDQTYDNLEILIIDDKGQDNSISKVNEIKKNHKNGKRVRIIDHVINRGTGATKNSAIENAQGEYLLFMDSDDYISNDCIEKLYNAISETKADMAVGSFTQFSINDNSNSSHICDYCLFKGSNAYNEFYDSKSYYVQTWNKLYKLSILRENNVYCIPSNTNEDVFFSFQLFPIIKIIVIIPNITYFYAVGNVNAATFNMRKNMIDIKRINQYIGILNAMAQRLTVISDINMSKYYWGVKARLIRDISRSSNTTIAEKRKFLDLIPSHENIERIESKKGLPYNELKYLYKNPITEARKEQIINMPIKILRSLKHIVIGK